MKLFRIDTVFPTFKGMYNTNIVVAENRDEAEKQHLLNFPEDDGMIEDITEIDCIDGYDIVILEHGMINQIENDRYNKKQSYGFDYERISKEDCYDYGWDDAVSTVEDLLKVDFSKEE